VVPGAPMRPDVVLCGSMFELAIRRHRWFESNVPMPLLVPPCDHSQPITGVYGHPHGRGGAWRNGKRPMLPSDTATWSKAMGIDWMHPLELASAIPPAYTEFIGTHLMDAVLAPLEVAR
jgi:DNA (cytosine-5)-methyltransferase 1